MSELEILHLVGPDEDNEIPVRSLQGWTVLVEGTFGLRPLTAGGRPVGFNTETQAVAWLVGGERG